MHLPLKERSVSSARARRAIVAKILLGLLVALVLTSATAQAAPKLPSKQLRALVEGRVLTFSLPPPRGHRVRIGKAIGIAEGSSYALLHMILDVARYRDYMPRIKSSRFLGRRGKATLGRIAMSLPWPVSDAWCTYRLTYTHRGGGVFALSWTMERGSLKYYRAHALIEPWDKSNDKAVITYELLVEPDTLAPNSLISRGTKHTAEMFLHRVRIRIKDLKRQHAIPADVTTRYR